MPLIDTHEKIEIQTIGAANALNCNLNDALKNGDDCTHEKWRDQYNHEVTALTSKMGIVSKQLASINEMQAEMSRTAWQSIQALNKIERRLAARPPASSPGTVIPLDIYVQAYRNRSIKTERLDDGIDVVLAHCIPQSKSHETFFNQIIPTEFLKELGSPIQGKNDSQLYSATGGRRNSRALVHLEDGERDVYGDVLWVPSPLKTERWLSLVIKGPSHDMVQSTRILHNLAIYRFTIDTLSNGAHLLSFAKENDQLIAKMAL